MSLSPSLAALLLGLCAWFPPASQAETLRSALKSLAQQEGFRIEGADQLGRERAVAAEGEVPEKLETLLKDYNYLLTYGPGNRIAAVRLTSPKRPGPKPTDRAYVQTTRIGGHHQISADLTGPDGDRVPVELMVDTGASMIVLPESLMAPLGFNASTLGSGTSQTASDTIAVKVGILKEVRVGGVTAQNVHVSFIPDDKLKETKLLGMSFLNHFKFSLDDEANELILLSK